MTSYKTIGKSVPRIEGIEKVQGLARYVADLEVPGAIWGKSLRSPHAHARVLSIDTSRAVAIPGVHAVLTANDIPETLVGRKILDMPMLARDRVRFIGEKVAVVAAETLEIGEAALRAIDVTYQVLPAVFDPLEAMESGSPLLHEEPTRYLGAPVQGEPAIRWFDESGVVEPIPERTNVIAHFSWDHGDIDAGFKQADRIFEHTFTTPRVHQAYMEPHGCVVQIEAAGKIQVRACSKAPFTVRRQLSLAIGVPEERISVHPIVVGGDFGGKGSFMDIPLAYFLAKASGRPIKMVMDYVEELTAGNPRNSSTVTVRTGVAQDGRITARQVRAIFDGGAYNAFMPLVLPPLVKDAGGVYRVPNTRIDGYSVYTNSVPSGHFRGPGLVQVLFAEESHMDMIAREMEMDPLEFRLLNLVRDGDSSPLGEEWHDIRAEETLRAAAHAIGWDTPKPGSNVGRGISLFGHMCIGGPSGATLKLMKDGTLALLTSLVDTGTGAHVALRQIVSEAMSVPLDRVHLVTTDTDSANFEIGSAGSRVLYTLGQAVLQASQGLLEGITTVAAKQLSCQVEEVVFEDGVFRGNAKALTLAELATSSPTNALTASVDLMPGEPHVMGFVAQAAEVEVDPETGRVEILKIVSTHDVGTIFNPIAHQGQIDGGVIQGLGFAVTEDLVVVDGQVMTSTFTDYKIPTYSDVPEHSTILLESTTGEGPFAAKSIGEASIAGVAPAMANAVFHASGARIVDLPITAEKVHEALRGSG
jgi:CO/xanthine dehydrogenase Mo-binding subunit